MKEYIKKHYALVIAVTSLLFYVILNLNIPHIQQDFYDFKSWGDTFLVHGPFGFYSHAAGYPTDYPPIYIYWCGFVSGLCQMFNANLMWQKFFFRLPSTLVLFASIFVFNKLLKHFLKSDKTVAILTIFYALAPASIIDVVWSQCDCFTLFYILLACLMFVNKKYFLTMLVCTLGLLTKAQFLFELPVFGFAILWRSIKEKRLPLLFRDIALCLVIYFAIFFPFLVEKMVQGQPLYLFQILFKQVGHSCFFTVNAFNIYMCFATQDLMYPIWYGAINVLILLIIVLFVCLSIVKNDSNENIVLLSALILTAIFMLSTNMHERYMLGALGSTMVAAYALKNKNLIICNWVFYVIQFFNTLWAWAFFRALRCDPIIFPVLFSILSVIAFVIMVVEAVKLAFVKKNPLESK